ncbi:DUF1642 domain-containing protein [Listeria monocytogenes]|nr:DUF1642 domain-containing protein [Listeria monocytogenes]
MEGMKKITKEYVKGMRVHNELTVISPPTVPECVAKWFEENKRDLESSIWSYIYCDMREDKEYDAFYDFMNSYDLNPIETLIMMQCGYYIEKEAEPLYVVKIPQAVEYFDYFLKVVDGQVTISCRSGYPDQPEYHLTEAEIRSVWDGYMELAEEEIK